MYEELWCVRYYDEHDDEIEVFYRGESLGKVTHHRTESYKSKRERFLESVLTIK